MMILVLGGTSTTHSIISNLTTSDYIVTVATEYGYNQFSEKYGEKVLQIRFTPESLTDFIREHSISEIIDTTHPHAKEITKTAVYVCKEIGIRYTDKVRSVSEIINYKNAHSFDNYPELAEQIKKASYQSIIITTGSNNIAQFSEFADISYVRILPFEKSIKACTEAGFHYSRIIAMQGPFSEEFNKALIQELNADCIITKNSGEGSGFDEKLEACRAAGIDILIINPSQPE